MLGIIKKAKKIKKRNQQNETRMKLHCHAKAKQIYTPQRHNNNDNWMLANDMHFIYRVHRLTIWNTQNTTTYLQFKHTHTYRHNKKKITCIA